METRALKMISPSWGRRYPRAECKVAPLAVRAEDAEVGIDEVPGEVKGELEFVFVSKMDQVLEAALEEMPKPKSEEKTAQPTPLPSN